jgi:hypothetical protein
MKIAVVSDVALCIIAQQKCTDISAKPAGSIIRVNDVYKSFV